MPDPEVLPVLRRLAGELPTLSYVYFTDRMAARVAQLKQAFAGRFEIWNLSSAPDAPRSTYLLTGPLCASFDVLAQRIDLPATRAGDVLAIGASGAYGPTASPFGFISHPPPRELAVTGDGQIRDVSEPLSG